MNIFYLDKDPINAAILQYNKHVVKMILESAQMLCTAHHELLDDPEVPYKPAHINHPSTIWVRKNTRHYFWLYEHMLALGHEYTNRYGKEHLSIIKCKEPLKLAPINMPTYEFEQPPQCMPDEYKDPCSVQAYWNYYIADKHKIANKTEMKYYERPIETTY